MTVTVADNVLPQQGLLESLPLPLSSSLNGGATSVRLDGSAPRAGASPQPRRSDLTNELRNVQDGRAV